LSSLAEGANPFVETALNYAFAYLSSEGVVISPVAITILASDSYYTTPGESTDAIKPTSGFTNFGIPLSAAHKTGLGSSAALVTAFTAALLQYFLPGRSIDQPAWRDRVHILAQAAHGAAQGKLGSGFDVAAAVYGSCSYRRFTPALLAPLASPASRPAGSSFAQTLARIVNDDPNSPEPSWDSKILDSAARMPKGLRIVLADVDAGSATPGMARGVLAWRAANPDAATDLWARLGAANSAVAVELGRLWALGEPPATGDGRFGGLTRCIGDVRALLREMGEAAGVAIEPPAQTALLDRLSAVDGVVGGVVPGAGGFDAVALLVEEEEASPGVTERLKAAITAWNESTDKPIGAGKVSLLPVRQDEKGIVVENVKQYGDWVVSV
jgi:phosphomevalonate kinase